MMVLAKLATPATMTSISNGVLDMLSNRWIATALTALLLTASGQAHSADVRSCVVDQVAGPDARRWVAGEWAKVTAGSSVPADAKLVTDSETRARITCDDGTVVTIGTATEVNLENLVSASGASRSVAMQLIEGIVGVFLPDPDASGFEVRTPVAIASVRSTRWLVEWQADDAAAVFIRSGTVAVQGPRSRRYILRDGEGITITAAGEPGAVKTWGAARVEQSVGRLGFDWQ